MRLRTPRARAPRTPRVERTTRGELSSSAREERGQELASSSAVAIRSITSSSPVARLHPHALGLEAEPRGSGQQPGVDQRRLAGARVAVEHDAAVHGDEARQVARSPPRARRRSDGRRSGTAGSRDRASPGRRRRSGRATATAPAPSRARLVEPRHERPDVLGDELHVAALVVPDVEDQRVGRDSRPSTCRARWRCRSSSEAS